MAAIRPRSNAPSDILSVFTEDVARIDMLKGSQEREYGELAREGNMEAYHSLKKTEGLVERLQDLERGPRPADAVLDPQLRSITYKVMRDNRLVEETTSFAQTRAGKTRLTKEGIDTILSVRAQEKLVTANLRFVITVAKKYENRGVPLPDLIQAGNIGLMHSAEKFDPDFGVRFITYAVWWIRQQIKREIDMHNGTMRESQTQLGRIRKVRKVVDDLKRITGRMPTVNEIKEATGFTADRIEDALEYKVSFSSLDEPVNSSDGGATLGQMIGGNDDSEEQSLVSDQKEFIGKFLEQTLSQREREILSESFGLSDGSVERRELSLADIGESRNITRERARQIRQRALDKLKKARPDFMREVADIWTTGTDMSARQERGVKQVPASITENARRARLARSVGDGHVISQTASAPVPAAPPVAVSAARSRRRTRGKVAKAR